MSFDKVIIALKEGKKARRKGWNGRTQYIEMGSCVSYRKPNGEVVNQTNDYIGNNVIVFNGTAGIQVGWLASQGDMLAEDWEIFD